MLSGADTLGATKSIRLGPGDLVLSCATLMQTLLVDPVGDSPKL